MAAPRAQPMCRRHRIALVVAVALAGSVLVSQARAQTAYQLNGAVSVDYSEQTSTVPETNGARIAADLRPGFVLQTGSERLAWRVGYTFAGDFILDGAGGTATYANQAELSLVAQLTPRSSMSLGTSASQGGTSFQLSQRAADAGQPSIRAPGDPDRVMAGLAQAFVWDASRDLRLTQALAGLVTATQDDLSYFDTTVTAAIALDRMFPRDALGAEWRPSVSVLRPLTTDSERYVAVVNSFVGRWSHDLGVRSNAQLTLGVQQVLTLTGSYPLAILPTGGLTVNYLQGAAVGALVFSHATMSDLQTGIVAVTDQVTVRGSLSLSHLLPRALSASAGFLHSAPLGASGARVAAGTGDAVQADVGLTWGLSDTALATLRYSLAYQFDQSGGLEPSLASVLLIGITGRYSNVRTMTPLPSITGQRVDGTDAAGFPDASKPTR